MGAERFGVKGYWPPTSNIISRGCLCEFIMSESMLLNVWICNRSLHKFTLVPSSELGSQEWKQTSTWLNWNSWWHVLLSCYVTPTVICFDWILLYLGQFCIYFYEKTVQVFMLFRHLDEILLSSSMVISSLECNWHYLLLKNVCA